MTGVQTCALPISQSNTFLEKLFKYIPLPQIAKDIIIKIWEFIGKSYTILILIIKFILSFFKYLKDFLIIFTMFFLIFLLGIQAIISVYAFKTSHEPLNIMSEYIRITAIVWWTIIHSLLIVFKFIWEIVVITLTRIISLIPFI